MSVEWSYGWSYGWSYEWSYGRIIVSSYGSCKSNINNAHEQPCHLPRFNQMHSPRRLFLLAPFRHGQQGRSSTFRPCFNVFAHRFPFALLGVLDRPLVLRRVANFVPQHQTKGQHQGAVGQDDDPRNGLRRTRHLIPRPLMNTVVQ